MGLCLHDGSSLHVRTMGSVTAIFKEMSGCVEKHWVEAKRDQMSFDKVHRDLQVEVKAAIIPELIAHKMCNWVGCLESIMWLRRLSAEYREVEIPMFVHLQVCPSKSDVARHRPPRLHHRCGEGDL